MGKIATTILLLSFSLLPFSYPFHSKPAAPAKAVKAPPGNPAVVTPVAKVPASATAPVAPVVAAPAVAPAPAPEPAAPVKPAVAKKVAAKPKAKPAAVIKAAAPAVVPSAEAAAEEVAADVEGLAQQDPRAGKILNEMSKKYQNLKAYSASFTQTLENPGAKIKETMKGDIVVMGNKFRLSMNGQEVINNGTTIWTYMKNENEVNISDYDPSDEEISPTAIYDMYKKGYKYTFVKEEKRGGQTYEVIELTPEERNNPVFKVELVINKADKSLDNWKMFRNNGNRYTYNITKFVPNPAVAATDFTFDKAKYKGVKVIDLR